MGYRKHNPIIDVSNKSVISDAEYYSHEVNQLYHPTGVYEQDSKKLVYSFDNINVTKFSSILLKEWFFLVKKNGYLIVDYVPTNTYDFKSLEDEMWWLWKGKFKILYHGPIDSTNFKWQDSSDLLSFAKKHSQLFFDHPTQTKPKSTQGRLRFLCQKTDTTIISGDSIDKWSFGIVTNGDREDWLKKIIQSIREQKIPNYEIIICGNSSSKNEGKDLSYIPFTQRSDRGWITMKKNLLVEHAQFQNICIIHDRIFLSKNWYKGFLKWGNCFEHISCVTKYLGNNSVGDWPLIDIECKLKNSDFLLVSSLDYRDWDRKAFVAGSIHIGKKKIFLENPWPINLYWNEGEDYFFSKQLTNAGHIPRINSHSTAHAFKARFTSFPKIKYNPYSTNKQHEGICIKRRIIKFIVFLKLYFILEIIDHIARNHRSVIQVKKNK